MSEEKTIIKKLQVDLENSKRKIDTLEQSLKGTLKENTVLRVDINVLQAKLKENEKMSTVEKNASVDVLETQLKYKIQECEALQKKVDEAKAIQIEMEKMIQSHAKDEKRIKELENQVKSLSKVVESLQKEGKTIETPSNAISEGDKNITKKLSKKKSTKQ